MFRYREQKVQVLQISFKVLTEVQKIWTVFTVYLNATTNLQVILKDYTMHFIQRISNNEDACDSKYINVRIELKNKILIRRVLSLR